MTGMPSLDPQAIVESLTELETPIGKLPTAY